ncbi:ExeA family protein [Thermosulfuriphilus sp.]
MYQEFYGLRENPFGIVPDPRFLYLGEGHREALAHLVYGVSQRKGFILITGEVGSGKTTLINALLEKIPRETIVALVSNPRLSRKEFFAHLARSFNLARIPEDKSDFIFVFTEFLKEAFQSGKNVVLIVDEAQALPEELFEEIRLLTNLETVSQKLVNIILVGQPELLNRLEKPELYPLKQRITYHYHLTALKDPQETENYIRTRLAKAGAERLDIFSPEAIKLIYQVSQGIPRLINILCDHALLTGYVREKKTIDSAIIEECSREIKVSLPTDAPSEVDHPKAKKRIFRPFVFVLALGILAAGLIYWFNPSFWGSIISFWKEIFSKVDFS